jgi:hypothetical protein
MKIAPMNALGVLLFVPLFALWTLSKNVGNGFHHRKWHPQKGGAGHCVDPRGSNTAYENIMFWPGNWLAKFERNVVNQNAPEEGLDSCFGSCAVVFSSGKLLGKGLGTEIDQHDAVFRMNTAPSLGFEHDVGSRTTVRVANYETCNSLVGGTATSARPRLFLEKCSKFFAQTTAFNFAWGSRARLHTSGISNYQDPPFWTLRQGSTSINKRGIMPLFHAMTEAEEGADRYDGISTGWYSIYLACRMCSRIRIYGKGRANYSSPNHYYEPDGSTEGNMTEYMSYKKKTYSSPMVGVSKHDYDLELRAIQRLAVVYHIDGADG